MRTRTDRGIRCTARPRVHRPGQWLTPSGRAAVVCGRVDVVHLDADDHAEAPWTGSRHVGSGGQCVGSSHAALGRGRPSLVGVRCGCGRVLGVARSARWGGGCWRYAFAGTPGVSGRARCGWGDRSCPSRTCVVARTGPQSGWPTTHSSASGTTRPCSSWPRPKTSSGFRTVPLDDATVRALKAHRARQTKKRLKWGTAWVDTGRVFTPCHRVRSSAGPSPRPSARRGEARPSQPGRVARSRIAHAIG